MLLQQAMTVSLYMNIKKETTGFVSIELEDIMNTT